MTDPAVQPTHYTRFAIEPRDFIQANKIGYAVGNIIKYVCRYDGKDGLRDLEKAKNYLEFLIKEEKGKQPVDESPPAGPHRSRLCTCPACRCIVSTKIP